MPMVCLRVSHLFIYCSLLTIRVRMVGLATKSRARVHALPALRNVTRRRETSAFVSERVSCWCNGLNTSCRGDRVDRQGNELSLGIEHVYPAKSDGRRTGYAERSHQFRRCAGHEFTQHAAYA